MKIHEIREMKSEELVKRIEEEEKNLVDLRFAHQLKQLTNTSKLKMVKKDHCENENSFEGKKS
jgi:large subunit ribosomal protein L29